MKVYKTWEAIKMLTEDNNLIFTTTATGVKMRLFVDRNGYLDMGNVGVDNRLDGNIKICDEWTLVQKPLTFMEVVESGKKVRVKHSYINNERFTHKDEIWLSERYHEIDELLFKLCGEFNANKLAEIIQNGQWYLEE